MAAADVSHPSASLQFGLDAAKGRDPAGDQDGGIAGAEKPFGAGRDGRAEVVDEATEKLSDLLLVDRCRVGSHVFLQAVR